MRLTLDRLDAAQGKKIDSRPDIVPVTTRAHVLVLHVAPGGCVYFVYYIRTCHTI